MAGSSDSFIEHEHTWTLTDVLSLEVPAEGLTIREYLVALTAQEALRTRFEESDEHIAAFDADCDAVVQQLIRPDDGELCLRVWVRLQPFGLLGDE